MLLLCITSKWSNHRLNILIPLTIIYLLRYNLIVSNLLTPSFLSVHMCEKGSPVYNRMSFFVYKLNYLNIDKIYRIWYIYLYKLTIKLITVGGIHMNDNLIDVLFDGESVLWQGKPNKLCYVLRSFGKLLPGALIFLLFDGFFIGTMISTGAVAEMGLPGILFLVIFFGFHLFPVWLCVGKIIAGNLEHKNIDYAITSRRIIARTGIIGLDFQSIDYADISNVRVDVSILERLSKVGTVIISTSSGQSVSLFAVEDPYSVYKKINKVFIDMKSDVHYPNAYRPDNNPGYNTKYTVE